MSSGFREPVKYGLRSYGRKSTTTTRNGVLVSTTRGRVEVKKLARKNLYHVQKSRLNIHLPVRGYTSSKTNTRSSDFSTRSRSARSRMHVVKLVFFSCFFASGKAKIRIRNHPLLSCLRLRSSDSGFTKTRREIGNSRISRTLDRPKEIVSNIIVLRYARRYHADEKVRKTFREQIAFDYKPTDGRANGLAGLHPSNGSTVAPSLTINWSRLHFRRKYCRLFITLIVICWLLYFVITTNVLTCCSESARSDTLWRLRIVLCHDAVVCCPRRHCITMHEVVTFTDNFSTKICFRFSPW